MHLISGRSHLALLALCVYVLSASCTRGRDASPTPVAPDRLSLVATIALDDGTIASASLTEDGRVLVFARPNLLAVFDTAGELQTMLGRSGAGPGEFRMLRWAAPGRADTVWAYDFVQRRLSLFTLGGAFIESWRIAGASSPNAVARLGTGEIVFVDPFMPTPARRIGLSVDTTSILSLRPPSTEPNRLTRWPWSTRFQGGGSVALIPQPLGPVAHLAASESSLFAAFGDRAEVVEFDPTGKELRRLPLDLRPRALTTAEITWARALADRPSTLEGVQALYRDVPLPANVPIVGGLEVDRDRLWVQPFRLADSVPTVWYAHSTRGARVDSLMLPAGAELLAIRAPFVLLKITAPSGDEVIGVYRILE